MELSPFTRFVPASSNFLVLSPKNQIKSILKFTIISISNFQGQWNSAAISIFFPVETCKYSIYFLPKTEARCYFLRASFLYWIVKLTSYNTIFVSTGFLHIQVKLWMPIIILSEYEVSLGNFVIGSSSSNRVHPKNRNYQMFAPVYFCCKDCVFPITYFPFLFWRVSLMLSTSREIALQDSTQRNTSAGKMFH